MGEERKKQGCGIDLYEGGTLERVKKFEDVCVCTCVHGHQDVIIIVLFAQGVFRFTRICNTVFTSY